MSPRFSASRCIARGIRLRLGHLWGVAKRAPNAGRSALTVTPLVIAPNPT
ncbi:MAG: hypothetical protein ACI8W1_003042 [Candidatus Azotimanducaceae bacterium]